MADQKKSTLMTEAEELEKKIPIAAKLVAGGVVPKLVGFVKKLVVEIDTLRDEVARLKANKTEG